MILTLRQWWQDDAGALIATEFLFVAVIIIIGIIPGLVSLRNATNVELQELANALSPGVCPDGIECTDPGEPVPIDAIPCGDGNG